MPHSQPKTSLEVMINVHWDGGKRVFWMVLPFEDILTRSASDTLLASTLHEKVRVPFTLWRRLEVQLAHVWVSGQSQVIYSHSSTEEHRTSQEEVIELLSMWQQHACLEPRSMRMIMTLHIDTAGVPLLPPRLSLSSRSDPESRHPESPERTLKVPVLPENESAMLSRTTSSALETEHITFDRETKVWTRIPLSRTPSA